MANPAKSAKILQMNGVSHKTKSELEEREKQEKALLSGVGIKARDSVKKNKVAHKEFKRVLELLRLIEKDDAVYQSSINDYCLLHAECVEYENTLMSARADVADYEAWFKENPEEVSPQEYYRTKINLLNICSNINNELMNKRKLKLQYEKESLFTIAAALRGIPKKQTNDEEEDSPFKRIGKRGSAG